MVNFTTNDKDLIFISSLIHKWASSSYMQCWMWDICNWLSIIQYSILKFIVGSYLHCTFGWLAGLLWFTSLLINSWFFFRLYVVLHMLCPQPVVNYSVLYAKIRNRLEVTWLWLTLLTMTKIWFSFHPWSINWIVNV